MKKFLFVLLTIVIVLGVVAGGAYAMRQKLVKKVCGIVAEQRPDIDSDHCIKGIAVALRDPNMCEMITGSAFSGSFGGVKVQIENPPKMECLTSIAAATNNTELCNKVGGLIIANTKIDCLYRVARANNNSSACNLIGSEKQSRVGVNMNRQACLAQLKRNGNIGEVSVPAPVVSGSNNPATEVDVNKGECRFDGDCPSVCEGSVFWKRGCDAQNDTCKKTFDENCADIKDTFGSYVVGKVCKADGCQTDTESINNKKKELADQKQQLSDQVKGWLAARQEATQLMLTANKNCLSGLAEVTNKFIIESATKLGMLPKTIWDVASDATNGLLDQLGSDPKKMSAEEFISLHCNLYKSLQTDLDVLEKKINKAQDEYVELYALEKLLP